jgi:hypothetical protein
VAPEFSKKKLYSPDLTCTEVADHMKAGTTSALPKYEAYYPDWGYY